jgi:hypothetical protein
MRSVTTGQRPWDPERLVHRQTYIDLIDAYLVDYGTRRDLARALGVSEAYISYLLKPLRTSIGRPGEHWTTLLAAAGYEVADAFKFAKTPSQARARQIAQTLVSDTDRRDALLFHVSRARTPASRRTASLPPLPPDAVRRALGQIGDVHQHALTSPVAVVAAASYAQVWKHTGPLLARIDARRYPADYAQALMFRHDTAQVLGRADLALACARRALGALPPPAAREAVTSDVTRLRVNALLAEAVTLNTLRLHSAAFLACGHAEGLPGFSTEPETWQRSFYEQRLTAAAGLPRASLYGAERTADRALALTASPVSRAGITRRLADVYLARPTGRSLRRAASLALSLGEALAANSELSPLRRAQIMRTLVRYHLIAGDRATAGRLVGECLRITTEADLIHQRAELFRELTAAGRGPARTPR